MIRTRFLIALALAALLLMVASTSMLGDSLAAASVPPSGKNCNEDEPCFIWATMGNMERGVIVTDRAIRVGKPHPNGKRRHRIVNACEFAYLAHEGLLSARTPRLKGDRLAERHGCDPRYFA